MHLKFPASRKYRCILIAVFMLAAAFGAWWLLGPTANEPRYHGHPLSYWVEQYEPAPNAGLYLPFRLSQESAAAVREIGTNAVPTMLRWMTRPENGLSAKVVTWVNDGRIPLFARRLLRSAYPVSYRPTMAILAFRTLGSDALDAVPSLTRMLYAPDNARYAAMALCAVGPEGATALTEEFPKIGDGILRANIVLQLEHGITPELELHFASFLGQRLGEDPQAAVRSSAAQVLGTLTNSATVAVPALSKALQDRDGAVRFWASASLGQFGSEATSAIAPLQGALNDTNPQVRLEASQALRSIQGTEEREDDGP